MSTLQTELGRLYQANAEEPALIAPDGTVRAMVLELGRPADWSALSAVWRGVQTDLELPAPAIAVSGIDAYQLWFSLAAPVGIAQAGAFLEWLRARYLGTVAPARIRMLPSGDTTLPVQTRHARQVPALQPETGMWSAFVAPDLAAIFSEDPWLDRAPNPDAQAQLLSRIESIPQAAFQALLARINPTVSTVPAGAPDLAPRHDTTTADPYQFLLDVMGNQAMEMHLRIEAAKALLPYSRRREGV